MSDLNASEVDCFKDLGMIVENGTASIPAAEAPGGRKFGIFDSMVSIGGIALLLTYGTREFTILFQQLKTLCIAIAAYFHLISALPYGPRKFLMQCISNSWSGLLWYGIQTSELLVLTITPVFLLMRARKPRQPFRALLTQPGTVAGLAVTFGFFWVTGWLHRLFFGRINDRTATAIAVGGTVALSWACLALTRKWRDEQSWVDRTGRMLGAAAIAVGH